MNEYEKGALFAWKIAKLINCHAHEGGIMWDTLKHIFPDCRGTAEIMGKYGLNEIAAKLEDLKFLKAPRPIKESELKPCPFCGGEGCVHKHEFVGYRDTFGVVCLDCCCETRQFYCTEAEAIEAWNSRAAMEKGE